MRSWIDLAPLDDSRVPPRPTLCGLELSSAAPYPPGPAWPPMFQWLAQRPIETETLANFRRPTGAGLQLPHHPTRSCHPTSLGFLPGNPFPAGLYQSPWPVLEDTPLTKAQGSPPFDWKLRLGSPPCGALGRPDMTWEELDNEIHHYCSRTCALLTAVCWLHMKSPSCSHIAMVHLILWGPPPRCSCAMSQKENWKHCKTTWGQRPSTQWSTHCDSLCPSCFSLALNVTAGGGHAGWIEALIQAPSWWIRLSMAGTGQCCWSAQRPKIRLGHPRQAATMTLALDGGTGHTRGAPMPGPRRRRWTCTGSPGVSPSRQPACAGTGWCRPRPWHGYWTDLWLHTPAAQDAVFPPRCPGRSCAATSSCLGLGSPCSALCPGGSPRSGWHPQWTRRPAVHGRGCLRKHPGASPWCSAPRRCRHAILYSWQQARRLSTARCVPGCMPPQRSSTEPPGGSPPPALRTMRETADLQRRLGELVHGLLHWKSCQVDATALSRRPDASRSLGSPWAHTQALQVPVQGVSCCLPTAFLGHSFGLRLPRSCQALRRCGCGHGLCSCGQWLGCGSLGLRRRLRGCNGWCLWRSLGCSLASSFLDSCAHHICNLIICGTARRGPLPAELGLLPHGCRHQGCRWLGRRWHCRRGHHCSLDAPCLPPHARPDFCKMAHKCTPNGQASAGFGHSSVWKSGHMALPFFNVAVSTLPLSWSGIWGAGAASASCRACCAASTNCCDSLSLFFTSWKLCAEAHIGWRSCRSNLSASVKPWARAASSSACGIASHSRLLVSLAVAPQISDFTLIDAAYLADE